MLLVIFNEFLEFRGVAGFLPLALALEFRLPGLLPLELALLLRRRLGGIGFVLLSPFRITGRNAEGSPQFGCLEALAALLRPDLPVGQRTRSRHAVDGGGGDGERIGQGEGISPDGKGIGRGCKGIRSRSDERKAVLPDGL